jgi:hypothetical protein
MCVIWICALLAGWHACGVLQAALDAAELCKGAGNALYKAEGKLIAAPSVGCFGHVAVLSEVPASDAARFPSCHSSTSLHNRFAVN